MGKTEQGTPRKPSRREASRGQAFRLAFCSLMAALGAALMAAAGLVPIMTYLAPMIAGALLLPVLREYGARWAWMVWAVTALLSLLLCADKEAALFYLFFGCYPILKRVFDRLPGLPLRALVKLAYFAGLLFVLYGLLWLMFGLDLGQGELAELGRIGAAVFYLGLVAAMLLFDLALRNLGALYEVRLRPKMKFPPV